MNVSRSSMKIVLTWTIGSLWDVDVNDQEWMLTSSLTLVDAVTRKQNNGVQKGEEDSLNEYFHCPMHRKMTSDNDNTHHNYRVSNRYRTDSKVGR